MWSLPKTPSAGSKLLHQIVHLICYLDEFPRFRFRCNAEARIGQVRDLLMGTHSATLQFVTERRPNALPLHRIPEEVSGQYVIGL
jgi:hypothetical protein